MKICWKEKMTTAFHIYSTMMIWTEMESRSWALIRGVCIYLIMRWGMREFMCCTARNPVTLEIFWAPDRYGIMTDCMRML